MTDDYDRMERTLMDLAKAVHRDRREDGDAPMIVTGAILLYEATDGDGGHVTGHFTSETITPTAVIGLCEMTRQYVAGIGGQE